MDVLEEELQIMYQDSFADPSNVDLSDQIKDKESKRLLILKMEEEAWRQKSRATWLNCGDHSTILFHHYASDQKNHKHIWDLQSEAGQTIFG